MYIAMNRFKVRLGSEADFEAVWKGRDSRLSEMKGFRKFHLLRGAANEEEGFRLYVSHSEWDSHEDFIAWTKSGQRSPHMKPCMQPIEVPIINRSRSTFNPSTSIRRCASIMSS